MESQLLSQTTFKIAKMDCAAEEQLVRLHLADQPDVKHLDFDLDQRQLTVTHSGDRQPIAHLLDALNLDTSFVDQVETDAAHLVAAQAGVDTAQESRLLLIVLLINFGLFLVEMTSGLVAQSMGLVADSLDMLADAIVYALSLYAVGKATAHKQAVARASGYLQLLLATLGMGEVIRRFLGFGGEPEFTTMILISLLALAGNVASLVVLQRTRSRDVHIRASWIFTSNDVLVNVGIIIAAILVYATSSNLPDLLIGAGVFVLVGIGALRILRLAA